MHFQQLNYTSEPKAAVFARIGRKNRDCRGGSSRTERSVTDRNLSFFDLFRNHPPLRSVPEFPFTADTPFRRSISPLTAAVHKMLIGFPCERLRRLQKHYICIQRMTVPCRRVMRRRVKRERLCNSGTIPVAVTSTTKAAQSPPLPPAGDGKACRPERVRRPAVLPSFGAFGSKSQTMRSACGDYLPVPARSLSYRFIPATPQPKSPFPIVTGHGAIRAKRRKRRRGRFDRDCRHEGRRGDSP